MESKEFDKEYHLGQIITKRKIIRETLWDLSLSISHNTVGLLYMGGGFPGKYVNPQGSRNGLRQGSVLPGRGIYHCGSGVR